MSGASRKDSTRLRFHKTERSAPKCSQRHVHNVSFSQFYLSAPHGPSTSFNTRNQLLEITQHAEVAHKAVLWRTT
jgi:hypothetical protein